MSFPTAEFQWLRVLWETAPLDMRVPSTAAMSLRSPELECYLKTLQRLMKTLGHEFSRTQNRRRSAEHYQTELNSEGR